MKLVLSQNNFINIQTLIPVLPVINTLTIIYLTPVPFPESMMGAMEFISANVSKDNMKEKVKANSLIIESQDLTLM